VNPASSRSFGVIASAPAHRPDRGTVAYEGDDLTKHHLGQSEDFPAVATAPDRIDDATAAPL
jgi:hypothetical protein